MTSDSNRIARINRLKWHCRRALLELDLVFQRFWARGGEDIDAATEAVLRNLLAMEDHDLWDLISGKVGCDDTATQELIQRLRTT